MADSAVRSTVDIIRSAGGAGGADASVTQPGAAESQFNADNTPDHTDDYQEHDETSVSADQSTLADALSGDDDSDPNQHAPESGKQGAKANSPTDKAVAKEVITVTDADGRRRKVEIDYQDRAAIKKAHELAAGARKWQAERDQARKAVEETSGKYQELNKTWTTLEQAWAKRGAEGVLDLLLAKQGGSQAWVQKQVERAKFMERASPEEIEALTARELLEAQTREVQQLRKEQADYRKEIETKQEQAEMRVLESRVNPTFEKYRFADKLGNPDAEHAFDTMLWTGALKSLEAYEERGVPITNELVNREFKKQADILNSQISKQADRRAKQSVEKSKQAAAESAQSSVRNGYQSAGNSKRKEANEMLSQGNLKGILRNWGTYRSVFGK